jgi:hypothetical protein
MLKKVIKNKNIKLYEHNFNILNSEIEKVIYFIYNLYNR